MCIMYEIFARSGRLLFPIVHLPDLHARATKVGVVLLNRMSLFRNFQVSFRAIKPRNDLTGFLMKVMFLDAFVKFMFACPTKRISRLLHKSNKT